MRYDKPCMKADWKHAFLMGDKREHVVIDGLELTAKNVWDYEGSREDLVNKIIDYFYNTGFVSPDAVSPKELVKQFKTLKEIDPRSALDADGSIKNTSRTCLDACRAYCSESFYSTKVNGLPSIKDVYKSKELLAKVLKNRLGWYTTTEKLKLEDRTELDGEHPYLFDISNYMVVKGCHSAMVSGNVSNFRPLVAKYLMSNFGRKSGTVLDLSAGWGARMLAAMSLDMDYHGIDPTTAAEVYKMYSDLKAGFPGLISRASLINDVSESPNSYTGLEDESVDYVIVCPPYFKLEEYSGEMNSTDVHSEYSAWLDNYWSPTVKNAVEKMAAGARFTLIMVEKWGKFELLADMRKRIEDVGLKLIDEMQYKTTRSHLTDKRSSGNTVKSTEKALTFMK